MKKLILSLTLAAIMSTPSMSLVAGRGDGAAVAAGLIGGAMIGTMASQSGRGSRREAREAKREVEELRREQQKEKISDIQMKMERQYMMQRSSMTTNLLIVAIVLLFLGLLALTFIVIKRK